MLTISALSAWVAPSHGAEPGPREVLPLAASGFKSPPGDLRPRFRWWWPGVAVQDRELTREVGEMAAAGYGGAEIGNLWSGLPPEGNPPETHMWGTDHWAARVQTALRAARSNDMAIDLTIGPQWPWMSPAVSGANIELSSQYLAFGMQPAVGPSKVVTPVPRPIGMDPRDARLVAVTAAQPATGSAEQAVSRARDAVASTEDDGDEDRPPPVMLDPATAVDLSDRVGPDGALQWDAPAGQWIIFGFWQAPTRQGDNPANLMVVDHLRKESAAAALGYLDRHLFDKVGEADTEALQEVFEESLELTAKGFSLWTGDFLEEFRARRDYHLTRFLPVVFVPGQQEFAVALASSLAGLKNATPVFDFPRHGGARVRRDYYQTLTDLWVDEHLAPVREWANRHGMASRTQVYGSTFDIIELARAVDVPETEDLYANFNTDFMRMVSSGAHLSGARKTSVELGVVLNADYMITLQELKRRSDRVFSAGVNQLVLHGFPYRDAVGATWPSWSPWSSEFSPLAFSEAWNPAIPLWRHMRPLAEYLARAQAVLQAGRPVADVAVYRDAYHYYLGGEAEASEPPVNRALQRRGYTFDFINPGALEDRATRARGGRLLSPGSRYGGLVVDLEASRRSGITDHHDAMAASTARRLLGLAEAGLPIVFVGRFPDRGVSYRAPADEDALVRHAVARLRQLPNVSLVKDAADVVPTLSDLGVRPAMRFGVPQDVFGVHRQTVSGDYWFLWNPQREAIQFTGVFAASRGAPQVWDLWSGERRAVAGYRVDGGRLRVPLKLGPLETAVIGFEGPLRNHVATMNADDIVVKDRKILLRSTQGGAGEATMSDGRRRTVQFGTLPAPVAPAIWELHVEGAVPEGSDVHDLRLTALDDWRNIPDIKDTSGTGTYRTTVTLPQEWVGDGRGAYLELGAVHGGVQVKVNGTLVSRASVPPARLDVGELLRPGANTVEVELTTTLKNRLNSMATQPGYNRFLLRTEKTQPYGLLGPVRLVPYVEAVIGSLDDGLGLPSARRCVSRRSFRIRLQAPHGQRLRSARVYVNAKSVRLLKGRRLRARVNLRGLPRGRVRVRIVATTVRGRRIIATRSYRTCASKRPRHRSSRRQTRRP